MTFEWDFELIVFLVLIIGLLKLLIASEFELIMDNQGRKVHQQFEQEKRANESILSPQQYKVSDRLQR